jgi:two-component system chemotaxis response regulator CheB
LDNRDLVAIGASAGGVDALTYLAQEFPLDFPAAVLITIHLSSLFPSELDAILSHAGPLAAEFAVDGEILRRGRIYIAPPKRHLLVSGDRLVLGSGPRENHARPAIDPMLRSIAVCCGARAIGLILTGSLSDGAAGLSALGSCGGVTIVQDPRDSAYSEMPSAAIGRAKPAYIAPLAEIPGLLRLLVQQPRGEAKTIPDGLKVEVEIARHGGPGVDIMDQFGERSPFTCLECGGVLWRMNGVEPPRFRCHTGHAYTADHLNVALDGSVRRPMACALRILEERIALARRLEGDARRRPSSLLANTFKQKTRELQREADVLAGAIKQMDRRPPHLPSHRETKAAKS